MIGRIGLVTVVFSATLFFVGCTGVQTQSGNQNQSGKQEELSSEAASKPTPEPSAAQRKTSEAPSSKRQAGPANETGEEASSQPPEEQRSPAEVLGLQYEYINMGAFEEAYSLFAEQSQQEVSLVQYEAFFEANAPYSVTGYSFSEPQVQGDSATLEAEFTANSASGSERLQRTQQFLRENGEWRVVMRPEQILAFTAMDNAADSQEDAADSQEEQPSPLEGKDKDSSEQDLYDCGDFQYQEDAQSVYEQDTSDPYGLREGVSFECIKRNIPGRNFTLHPDLALSVYKRQARDGHLRRAVGPDGTQPRSNTPRGQQLLREAYLARAYVAQ